MRSRDELPQAAVSLHRLGQGHAQRTHAVAGLRRSGAAVREGSHTRRLDSGGIGHGAPCRSDALSQRRCRRRSHALYGDRRTRLCLCEPLPRVCERLCVLESDRRERAHVVHQPRHLSLCGHARVVGRRSSSGRRLQPRDGCLERCRGR